MNCDIGVRPRPCLKRSRPLERLPPSANIRVDAHLCVTSLKARMPNPGACPGVLPIIFDLLRQDFLYGLDCANVRWDASWRTLGS